MPTVIVTLVPQPTGDVNCSCVRPSSTKTDDAGKLPTRTSGVHVAKSGNVEKSAPSVTVWPPVVGSRDESRRLTEVEARTPAAAARPRCGVSAKHASDDPTGSTPVCVGHWLRVWLVVTMASGSTRRSVGSGKDTADAETIPMGLPCACDGSTTTAESDETPRELRDSIEMSPDGSSSSPILSVRPYPSWPR